MKQLIMIAPSTAHPPIARPIFCPIVAHGFGSFSCVDKNIHMHKDTYKERGKQRVSLYFCEKKYLFASPTQANEDQCESDAFFATFDFKDLFIRKIS